MASDTARKEQDRDTKQSERDRASKTQSSNKKAEESETMKTAKETIKKIDKIQEQFKSEVKESAHARQSKAATPADPDAILEPRVSTGQALAAGSLSAARTQLERQITSEEKLRSDPRYERDQKIFEMGQTGRLGLIPPSEAELAVQQARAGISPEVQEKIPHSVEEQVEDDMKRIKEAEDKAAEQRKAADDLAKKNEKK